jgi:hypothetical protein
MADFLAEEKHEELLYQGWTSMGQMNGFLAQQAQQKGDVAGTKKYKAESRSALRTAWKYVPESQIAEFGNSLAWTYYEGREDVSDADKAFALEVAKKVNDLSKDDVNTIDTYACCPR